MNASRVLWRLIRMFGIEEGRRSVRMVLCSVFSAYMLGQAVLSGVMRWDSLPLRYLAMEDVACTVFSTAMILEHALTPRSLFQLMRIIDRPQYVHVHVVGLGQRSPANSQQMKRFVYILSFFMLNFAVPCFLISWYRIVSSDPGTLSLTDLVLPYECWLPYEPDNLYLLYLVLMVCNAGYLMVVASHMVVFMGATIIAIDRVNTDIRQLQLAIAHAKSTPAAPIKRCLAAIINHHNIIIRDVKAISEAVSFSSLNMHTCAFLLSGLSMYWFIEGSSTVDRMRYVVSVVMVAAIVYVYSVNGQTIQSQGERLRQALYAYEWHEKPNWLKKSFLLMMAQATRPLQVKPLALYVLDFNSFTSMLNGAYAFTNILRTFKKRQHT